MRRLLTLIYVFVSSFNCMFPQSFKETDWVIEPQFEWGGGFYEGMAKVRINGKYGYINASGHLVAKAICDDAKDKKNGYAAVAKNIYGELKWGFINKNGSQFIAPKYADVYNFSEGYAAFTNA